MEISQKTKFLLYHPALLILNIFPQKTLPLTRKDTGMPMFIAALFTIADMGTT